MLPDDLIAAGYHLVERNDRYLLISTNSGVAAGATLDQAIAAARNLLSFILWVEREHIKGESG